jgi:hypothetical protein
MQQQQYSNQQQQLSALDMQTAMEVAALLGENTPPRQHTPGRQDQQHQQHQYQSQSQMYEGASFVPSQNSFASGSDGLGLQQFSQEGANSWMMDPSQSSSQYLHSQHSPTYNHYHQQQQQNSSDSVGVNFPPPQYIGYTTHPVGMNQSGGELSAESHLSNHQLQHKQNQSQHQQVTGYGQQQQQQQWNSRGGSSSGSNSNGVRSREPVRSGMNSSHNGGGVGTGETTINVTDEDLNRLLSMSFDASVDGSGDQMDI